jgi:hypothetical protein
MVNNHNSEPYLETSPTKFKEFKNYVEINTPSFQQDIIDKCLVQISDESGEVHRDFLSILFAALGMLPAKNASPDLKIIQAKAVSFDI